jgi:membrane-associated phospholipid phosphatase
MDVESFHLYELGWIHFIQQVRSPVLDLFAMFLNILDTPAAAFVLIATISIGYRSKEGFSLLVILLLSAWVNGLCKNIFALPRPFDLDPTLGLIFVKGYGFPSGAAQSAILFPLILFSRCPTPLSFLLGFQLFGWLSFSRVYLGVHFPSDIVGGWILGGVLWLIYQWVFPLIERYLDGMSLNKKLFLLFVFSATAISLKCSDQNAFLASVFLSFLLGACFALDKNWLFEIPRSRIEFVLRSFFGLIGSFLIYEGCRWLIVDPLTLSLTRGGLIGLWIGCLAFLIWNWIACFSARIFRFK